MGIILNILVIIFAVIAFLIIYYRTLYKDRKSQDYTLPFREIRNDYETGEEIGVDRKTMSVSNDKKVSEEIVLSEELDLDIEASGSIQKKDNHEDYNKKDSHHEDYPLIDKYNKNFVRLFNRDPNYLFSYWEINNHDYYKNLPCLRLYSSENNYKDIEVNHQSISWYIESEPDKEYWVSIGYKKDGIFFPLETSRKIRTPLDRPSNVIDEHWMTIEELSRYSYRVEMDSISIIKNFEGKKIQEELEADSLTLVQK